MNTSGRKQILIALTVLLLTGMLLFPVYAKESFQDKPNVLFISSYNLSFPTIPLQIKGLQSVLTEEKADLDFEFMDTKRFSSEADLQLFYQILHNKLSKLPPYDAVILGDDAALLFALQYQDSLFQNTPMVFLGINNMELARTAGHSPFITGIVEATSQNDNIELAIKLRPQAEELIAVVDNTLTGQGDQSQFLRATEKFPAMKSRLINSSELTQSELIQELESINPDSIVFFLTLFEDKDGHVYTIGQGARFLAQHVPAPVFRMSVGGVGDGLLGGVLFAYDTSGEMAADMVEQILDGVPADSIPVVMDSPSYGYFDQTVLKKYNLDASLLPENSIIINQEPGFLQKNHTFMLCLGISAGIILICFLVLTWNDYRRRALLDHDQVTGLYSRLWMTRHLSFLINHHQKFAVYMLDFDNFKWINDSLGHVYGDEVLRQVADRLKKFDSSVVLSARFGGDEFFGIIHAEELAPTRYLAGRILSVFDKPFLIRDQEIQVYASMGIARYPQDGDTSDALIANADMAMYTVKNAGKNSFLFFEKRMQDALHRQTEVSILLRDALENDGFCLVYQPQVDAQDGRLIGFEALLRLKSGLSFPDEFIPVAEQEGHIIEIGRLVADMALSQIADWRQTGYVPVPVSINFSNVQIRDREFPEYVFQRLLHYDIAPELLDVEITESTFLTQDEDAGLYMERLTRSGIRLTLDDFGSGYSAIRYFRFVNLRRLKLDKSLLAEYHQNHDLKMLSGIIHMSHDMGLEVVAEGVETEEEVHLLRDLSCDYIQGYYYGRPMSPENAAEYMEIAENKFSE